MSAFISSILEFSAHTLNVDTGSSNINNYIAISSSSRTVFYYCVRAQPCTFCFICLFRDLNQIWDILSDWVTCPLSYIRLLWYLKNISILYLESYHCLIMMYRDILLFGNFPTVLDFLIVGGF